MTFDNITFEEKLARLARGASVSPEASHIAFENFCAEPVITALEEQYAFFLRTKLVQFCRKFRVSADKPLTFAGCASIIAGHFMKGEDDPEKIRPLIDAFFQPFDEIASFEMSNRSRNREPASRKMIPEHLQKFYDVMIMPLGDLYEIVKGKTIPVRTMLFQVRNSRNMGYSCNMRLLDLFCELKAVVDPTYNDTWGVSFNRHFLVCDLDVTVGQLRPLIEYFVMPAAAFYKGSLCEGREESCGHELRCPNERTAV